MLSRDSFTGVILAGGRSSRMGTDKALLSAPDGSTLLHWMRNLLFEAGASKVIILGREDVDGGIADQFPYSGPVPAITDYLAAQIPGGKHLFVPVDMPSLTVPLLQQLSRQNGWAHYQGYYLPFLAVAGSVRDETDRIGGLLRFQDTTAIQIEATDLFAFANVNSPQDYEAWHPNQPRPPQRSMAHV